MFKNWKTTVAGFAAGALYLLNAAAGQHMTWKQWALALAMAAAGAVAKDHNK
jgi:hypothetical protein